MLLTVPQLLAINESIKGNPIEQMGENSFQLEGTIATYESPRLKGFVFQPTSRDERILIVPQKSKQLPNGYSRILGAIIDPAAAHADCTEAVWLSHPMRSHPAAINHEQVIRDVLHSWLGAFAYVAEDPAQNILGLRNPQIGAVHAVHAHWTVTDGSATIVMPTGTGKTEVMLSILVSAGCSKLLVVVPTDPLRAQLARKFLTLGILKSPGCLVLRAEAKYPIVCTLKHLPKDASEVDEIFARCQVIITTSSIAGQCNPAVQERMAYHCPFLFIDEAHHVEAPTWSAFKERFKGRKIMQFTATPFREDGKPLDGEIIYKYPLKKAQSEGFFKPIRFESVIAFTQKESDRKIAEKAVEILRRDENRGHTLMARVESVTRATSVFKLYEGYSEFNPVQLHTGITSLKKRDSIRQDIISGKSRIVVCVDMLGEGFDLPELKIAAFHDIRKTLAVTLQLAGRFTRARSDLGDATFIANTGDVDVRDELRKLYTRDPDWNVLLPQLSDTMIGEQISLQDFLHGFTEFTNEIPLKTVRPATSMVAYKTTCGDWTPEKFREGIPAVESCAQVHHTINSSAHTLVVVTARRVALDWTDVESLFSWDWELYVVIWSPEHNLLFINSSTNSGEYRSLANAVAGPTATLIKGNDVFRSFAGVNRLRLQNVGLTEQLGRNVRYTGRMGADVGPELPDVQRRRATKSVLSGTGYENGEKATVGASRKGRIWSHRRDRVDRLADWCKAVGSKLLDATIDPEEVLKGTLEAKTLTERPAKMPICVDWPEEFYKTLEAGWMILLGEREYSLAEVSIELSSPSRNGPLRFSLASDGDRVELELSLFEHEEIPNYRFEVRGDVSAQIKRGPRSQPEDIAEFFYDDPPMVWFADGSSLEGNQYFELKSTYTPYDTAKIATWDWAGVNLRKESQGQEKHADSIQAKVIRHLKTGGYHVIVDDDGKGEAADVVAIRINGDTTTPVGIDVEFYQCKYSLSATSGQRVDDLYEVCGQAQKSINWASSPEKRTDLFTHLMRRAAHRREKSTSSRYEEGDEELLQTIREISRLCLVSLKIFIVQPGLSKANASHDQLELLSVTENHLKETFRIPFGVIGSP